LESVGRRRVYYAIIAAGLFSAAWLGSAYLLPDQNEQQESAEHLRDVLTQEDSWQARAAAAAKLGEMRDEESMPALLQAMEDPDPVIRGRAAVAVRKIMRADYYFRAGDSPERRKEVIAAIKRDWEAYLRYKNRQTTASADNRGLPQ
jgi:HEAT repeat protein